MVALRRLQLTFMAQTDDSEADLAIQNAIADRLLLLNPSLFRPAIDDK